MGRRSKRATVTDAVTTYLALAAVSPRELYPLEVGHIASVVGCSRSTLYNYGLDQLIVEAAERQRLRYPYGKVKTDALNVLRAALKTSEAQNRALLERLVLVEANAMRLGIDADELYRAVLRPARMVPGTRRRR